ncbi:integrase catalytic domain-containing protein [Trichonephila inaurata madagascariensis]|uniref:Integrase catalytic domain-containing protein n=1 Tax=Trichonephila inaurata madagascariensis TaxID=2747483 RepID=A0A8X6ISM7_9ARAC|nr:integrase catalytic domain-containing protein [Trichonephila inaurata madagascariensis]
MSNLPKHRVKLERPFFSCGIDYAGLVLIKCNKVGDLATDSFIAALRRFSARRGAPLHIYSDNGTNFVGAQGRLDEIRKLWLSLPTNEAISYYLSKSSIDWHFIPPSYPHSGGIWESGIRTVKFHLKIVLGDTILTSEELTTLLTQIEELLNSKPFSYFLCVRGASFNLQPQISLSLVGSCYRISNVAFGRSGAPTFSLPYNLRNNDAQPNLKEDDIVLIKEESPPGTWPLARVLQVHPGNDGLVQVATVKAQDLVFKRPDHKLRKFPI